MLREGSELYRTLTSGPRDSKRDGTKQTTLVELQLFDKVLYVEANIRDDVGFLKKKVSE